MSDRHEEEARAIVHAWLRGAPCGFQLMARPDNMLPLIEAVAGALRAAERRGMERAAKIAELPPITDTILCGDTCDYIAAAIRAEKEKL